MLDELWLSEDELYRLYDDISIPFDEAKLNWVLYNNCLLPLNKIQEIIKNEEEEESY